MTAFPVIETLAQDVSAYITTNVISITDGQIFLSSSLFLSGTKPAIDTGLSVSRVGSAAQWVGFKMVGSNYKLELGQFGELQAFSMFAADLGVETLNRLKRGLRLTEMLKQNIASPIPLTKGLGILSFAGQDIIHKLGESDVRCYLGMYFDLPSWVQLFIPIRLIGKALLCWASINFMIELCFDLLFLASLRAKKQIKSQFMFMKLCCLPS